MAVTQMTLRNVDAELSRRLRVISEEQGESLNRTVLALLRDAANLETRRTRLRRYVTWTPADLDEFTAALHSQPAVDQWYWECSRPSVWFLIPVRTRLLWRRS